jgi:uncharacterized protein YciI
MLLAAFAHAGAHGAQTPTATPTPTAAPPSVEHALVFVALYERGPAWKQGRGVFEQEGIEAHMEHLRANARMLLGAGRFAHATDPAAADQTVGLVIVTATSLAEAEALFAADPAVSNKVLKVTVRPWETRRVKAYPSA